MTADAKKYMIFMLFYSPLGLAAFVYSIYMYGWMGYFGFCLASCASSAGLFYTFPSLLQGGFDFGMYLGTKIFQQFTEIS